MVPKILISIPAKNEAESITAVITSSVEAVMRSTLGKPSVLVISDGSNDATTTLAKACGAEVIEHDSSKGLGYVFGEAVEYALDKKFDIMLTIDGDGSAGFFDDVEDLFHCFVPTFEIGFHRDADAVEGGHSAHGSG